MTLAGLAGELRHYGAAAPEPVRAPSAKTHDSLIAWESALRAAIGDARERVRDASANAIMRELKAIQSDVDLSGVSLGVRPASVRGSATVAPAADGQARARIVTEVDKVVGVLAALRDSSKRDELTAMAARILGTSSRAQTIGDLLTLKTAANQALQVQDSQDLAAEAVLEVAHLESPEADRLRARARCGR